MMPRNDDLPSALVHVEELRARLAGGVLALDYDGTLTPIVEHPADARLASVARRALEHAGARGPLAILSGRALDDLQRRVAVDGLVYAGCHGFEIAGPTCHYQHEGARAALPELAQAAAELRTALAQVPGALVEDKCWAVTVHDRLVPREQLPAVFRAVERALCDRPHLQLCPGKRVLELRPALPWDKGRALEWIVAAIARPGAFVLYLGDDRTDEDAFAAIASHGAGVVVGPHGATAASYSLRDPSEVVELLERLA